MALVSSQRLILLLILLLAQKSGFGQSESSSVLTKNAYLSNPTQYLSKVNPKLVPSGTLIDRVVYDDLILNMNGKDKVTTIAANDWVRMYEQLRYANNDTSYLVSTDVINMLRDAYYHQSQTYLIGVLDVDFQRVSQSALDKGELVEQDNFLDVSRANAHSFVTQRAMAASCLSHNIYGDRVNFFVSKLLFLTNHPEQRLQSIAIDFGNGEGFRRVSLGETISVDYSSRSEYLELITKLTYQNISTGKADTYYSHSSVFRTGSSTVPVPDNLAVSAVNGKATAAPPSTNLYYPAKKYKTTTVCAPCQEGEGGPNEQCCYPVQVLEYPTKLSYNILSSSQNTSGKLRRPFIVTDGFDPGDKRDYYCNNLTIDENTLPKDKDQRGLYQLVNGDPSPWYPGETSPNLVAALRADGYDLVFINFLDGAGNIQVNALTLQAFFNEVINSNTYRDNKTEEAILVGPSMGGIITRMMLKKMENAGENPFVKTWVSFDSPQQGAYIPLGLQQIIRSLEDAVPKGKKGPLQESLEKLNSPAARQLLLYHYTVGTKGTSEHDKLYADLNNLGYPTYSKNYAITNGGTGKLYAQDGSQIVNFTANLVSDTHFARYAFWGLGLFKRTTIGMTNSGSQIAYENTPGGWNTALYSFNLNKGNAVVISENSIPHTKATFIPTASAFGIKVTQSNVGKDWKYYRDNKITTPFDVIRGMEGLNEEHVKISVATRNYLMDELRLDFDNTTRPRVRTGQVLNQKVKGKETITAKFTIQLGGGSNSFTLESGADVITSASQSITLLPGFTAQSGANFVAKIATINYNTVLRSAVANLETTSVDYTQLSPFTGAVYSYQQDELISVSGPDRMEVVAYPNPLEDVVILQVTELEEPYAKVEISNALGQIVYQSNHLVNGLNPIDLTKMGSGLYYGKVTYRDSKTKSFKLIKL